MAGAPHTVKTPLDLTGSNTRIYEAHYGMTQEWANQLIGLGRSPNLPLSFDRVGCAIAYTLGQLAAQVPGPYHESFQFVLNNMVAKDNRIPTYGMTYAMARERNALPVPDTQYGGSGTTPPITYNYWDQVALSPPDGATFATIDLVYQSTSREYMQFLYLANSRGNAFLADEGINLLNAWMSTGMSEPVVMASTTWGSGAPAPACVTAGAPQNLSAIGGRKSITLAWSAGSPTASGGYRIYNDQAGKLQFTAGVGPTTLNYKDGGLTNRMSCTYVITGWNECNGNGLFDVGTDTESPVSNSASAVTQ